MLVNINAFKSALVDHNTKVLPAPGEFVGNDDLTAAGESAAMPAGTIMVEVTTDTAITINAYGAGSNRLMPANSSAFFPATAGQTFTVAAA